MQKQVPTLGKLLIMVLFALSCFGILLYLWVSFGGPIPFQAKGYRVNTYLAESGQLATEADVRISGVNVGKVKELVPSKNGRTKVTIQIDDQYAPRPKDSRLILRQKTLLGETYVELSPGDGSGPKLADGGTIPGSHVAPSVELDEIFRTFDPKTRAAFEVWMQQQGAALDGRGADLNDALGNLVPFTQDTNDLLKVLNSQQGAVQKLLSNTAVVMSALNERDGQLSSLIRNANTVFATTARRDQELSEAFVALPTFEVEARKTLKRVNRFVKTTDPLIDQLHPVAKELSPTLQQANLLAPELKQFFVNLTPLTDAAKKGLPALDKSLKDLPPLLGQLDPFLRNLNPILETAAFYRREIVSFFANTAAATQATDIPPGEQERVHYLRVTNPLNVDLISAYPKRLSTNRSNPYEFPNAFAGLAEGLKSYETRNCNNGPVPQIDKSENPYISAQLADLIEKYVYTPGGPTAPACKQQEDFTLQGQTTQFPQVLESPKPSP